MAVNDTLPVEAARGDGTAVTPKIIEATKLQDGQLYGKHVMPMDGGADAESAATTTTAMLCGESVGGSYTKYNLTYNMVACTR